jgi:hypothetical protein
LDSLVNPFLEGLVRAEEAPLSAVEGSVGEEGWSGTKKARVDRLSFAHGAKDKWVSRRKIVSNVLGYCPSVQGRQLKMEVEGRVGVVGDPSFSGVVRELFEEAREAVIGGG